MGNGICFRKIDSNWTRLCFALSGSCSLVLLKYMPGFMKAVHETNSSVFFNFFLIISIYLFFFCFCYGSSL